ncbi:MULTISPECIES: RHS repeat domain-containing protein, partial [unclassified Neisseria]
KTGNLLHSTDQRTGTTHFEYDKLGQPLKVQNQTFAFDPAYNLINEYGEQVKDNRIASYNDIKFFYDDFGNTIHKEHSDGSTQNLHYDLFDRLVKVETFKKNAETGEWDKEVWAFEYDALDRRVSKGRLKNGGMETIENVSDGLRDNACLKTQTGKDILDSEITFLWDGSRLLQEHNSDGLYTYIYTDQDNYEPLAQIHNYTNTEKESRQEINYFHCDQIGIPREMTDKDGKLLWFGKYDAWGKLTEETNVTGKAHQPFRLQNQYCDSEIRLHYNFFRYYDPDVGRFVNQDPIGLWGGSNFYQFASNSQIWFDPLGLARYRPNALSLARRTARKMRLKLGKKAPTATCAVVDKRTRRSYVGFSGTKPTNISARLFERMPSESRTPWSVINCAEIDAVNQALKDGARMEDLEIATVRTSDSSAFARCDNCKVTFSSSDVTTG